MSSRKSSRRSSVRKSNNNNQEIDMDNIQNEIDKNQKKINKF